MKKNNPFLVFAWIISLIATTGSLYFSEVAGFIPCTLCWYQRILMYPLVYFLGVAVFKNDTRMMKLLLPISVSGFLIASYHYALQKIPSLKALEVCQSGVPCSGQYINWFSFITIPFLSLTSFFFISLVFIIGLKKKQTQK